MSLLKLYHGSHFIIRQPLFGMGNPQNDYGRGFYCTETLDLAKEWACSDQRNGFANIYEFNPEGLRLLRLNSPEYNILNWLAILTKYRSYWQNGSIAEEAKNYLQQHFFVDPAPYDAYWVDHKIWKFEILPEIGKPLSRDQFGNMKEVIDNMSDSDEFAKGREKARRESWAYIGKGAEHIVDYLTGLYIRLQKEKEDPDAKEKTAEKKGA